MYKSKCKKAKAPLLAGLAFQVAFLLQQTRLVGGAVSQWIHCLSQLTGKNTGYLASYYLKSIEITLPYRIKPSSL